MDSFLTIPRWPRKDKADEAALNGRSYEYILDEPYRWSTWAFPTKDNGELDDKKAIDVTELSDFVSNTLFPYLAKFKARFVEQPDTIEYRIGEIFSEFKN